MTTNNYKFMKFVRSEDVVDLTQVTRLSIPPDEKMTPECKEYLCKGLIYDSWYRGKKPYFRVYPSVVEFCQRLDIETLLKNPPPDLPFGLKSLELELPDLYWDTFGFATCVFDKVGSSPRNDYGDSVLSLVMDKDFTVYYDAFYRKHLLESYVKGKYDVYNTRYGKPHSTLLKLLYGVLLIGDNPDLIKPVPLSKDKEKYERTLDAKYIDKARRRGVFGFDVGKDIPTEDEYNSMVSKIEQSERGWHVRPHIRMAHLSLYHTGKGGAIPKIILRKGSVVNKGYITRVPQGYYGKEDLEDKEKQNVNGD